MNGENITVFFVPDWVANFHFPLGLFIHLLLFALVTVHCLKNRREASSSLLWIFMAWAFPVIGPVIYVCFGINRVPLKALRKHRSNQEFLSERKAREEETMPLNYWRATHEGKAAEPPTESGRDINAAMDAVLNEYPLLQGNRVEILVSGDEAFPAMEEAIENATHHIHLQTFILGNDRIGRRFLDLLKRKAESGVKVRLLYDRFGSSFALLGGLFRKYRNVPNLQLIGWTQANVLKRQFQVNLRNHRKLLVVDGHTAFAGGINLQEVHTTRAGRPAIRDYHFRLRGPIVQELQYSFLRDWYFMADEDPELLLNEDYFPHIPEAGSELVRVINGGPSSELEAMADVFFNVIVSARRELLAVTPYLVPSVDILRAIRSAAQRGVMVRLVVPRRNNHLYAGLAGRALYDDLLSAGVRIFERREPFIHAKAMIVDDTMAIIGTANLDVRSLRLNYETNLAVYDARFVMELKQLVREEIDQSDEISLASWRLRPLRQRLMENFCNLLTPIL